MAITAVEKRLHVRLAPADAFELFTRHITRWWPLATHAYAPGEAADVLFDARVGGMVSEVTRSGTYHVWGTLTQWDPPRRFAMAWHPGRPEHEATRLCVQFGAAREGGRTCTSCTTGGRRAT